MSMLDRARARATQAREGLSEAARQVDARTCGVVGTIVAAFRSFGEAKGSEAAAGLAYYTLFSLFPLLLALVALGSFFFDSEEALQQVVQFVADAIPVSQALIEENLLQVLQLRGAVGAIGLIGALWSASGAFAILSRHINLAWPEAEARGVVKRRLVALGMVASLTLLLILSLVASTALNVLTQLRLPIAQGTAIYDTLLWTWLSNLIPWLLSVALFTALYRWVPDAEVPWRAALLAGLVVAIAWELVGTAFAWYVGSGMASYKVVYGSLGAVVALMFWIYLGSWIILFGAHLSAAIGRRR